MHTKTTGLDGETRFGGGRLPPIETTGGVLFFENPDLQLLQKFAEVIQKKMLKSDKCDDRLKERLTQDYGLDFTRAKPPKVTEQIYKFFSMCSTV